MARKTGHVTLRCLRQRAAFPTIGAKGAEPNVERKHQSHPEIQGPFPAGTGRQGERGAADRLQMGAGSFPYLKILTTHTMYLLYEWGER